MKLYNVVMEDSIEPNCTLVQAQYIADKELTKYRLKGVNLLTRLAPMGKEYAIDKNGKITVILSIERQA
jgi:hypothetical protein